MYKFSNIFRVTICIILLISGLNNALWGLARSMHEIHDHGHHNNTSPVILIYCTNVSGHDNHGFCLVCETFSQLKPEGTDCKIFMHSPAFIPSQMAEIQKHQGVSQYDKGYLIRAPPLV